MTRFLKLTAAAAILAGAASGCAAKVLAGNPGLCRTDDPANRQSIKVPPTLAGLSVSVDTKSSEKLRKENQANPSYMCDGVVFALRRGKELKAVMTLERLTSDADTTDPDFRERIVAGISGTQRKPERIGDALVYKTKSNQQLFAIWFKDRFLGILMVREDQTVGGSVDFERALIEAVSLEPAAA